MTLNDEVRGYWEAEPCGTAPVITGTLEPRTREWFERVEEHRYRVEPYIHSVAQFTRHHGEKVLEVGVGAGTDHLQWARAGADCHGVDLTEAAIETTRARLAMYGFTSRLQRVDAERLPFDDGTFDVVYSWGVVHHSERPDAIVREIHRVLRPGGVFKGMVYGLYSPNAVRFWVKHALLAGRPWRSLRSVVWEHVESVGTQAYTNAGVHRLLSPFGRVELQRVATYYDGQKLPGFVARALPDRFGWFIPFRAYK
ncbi:MAG TPA: class I SAM-dependent methyltransferase [Longimicrobium sp.]|nr:class I SAM-dependent methyltransferase [Longimicrobium sp.]